MGKSIKNRVFGSDVPNIIKKKIEARQLLSRKDRLPNDQIRPSLYPDDRSSYYTYGELTELNFGGVADLSSRTPFARLWTAVNVSTDVLHKELSKEDAAKWEADRENSVKDDVEYKDRYLKEIGETAADKRYEVHQWVPVEESEKIYILGNHLLGTEQVGPNTSRTVSAGSVPAGVMKELLPFEQETDQNVFLKPPAGITSISSETHGPLGALKKTTVKFTVHNFHDFEKIYLRYFMKPGAQVFVDFGWDTGMLYDPKELLKVESRGIEDKLYGDYGYVTISKGDMESLYGHVINYDASVRDDGGFDCSIDIISKNASILSNSFDQKLKDRVKYGLDIEIMGYAISGVLGDYSIYNKATKWGQADSTEEELRYAFTVSTIKLLGGTTAPLPGMSDTKTSMAALEHGVFYAGTMEENMKLFVNYGWFEDKFLNKELAFSDSKEELTNEDKSSVTGDEDKLFAKFNSRNSFISFNEKLKRAMMMRGFYEGAIFLYPETWGSQGPSYNVKKGMIPDRFDDVDQLINTDNYIYSDNGTGYSAEWEIIEKEDKEEGRIPLREIFISVDALKASFDQSNTTSEFLKSIMNKIKDASGGIIDLGMQSNNYGQHTISFIDKNLLSKGSKTPSVDGELSDFLKEMLVFNPYSPDTIVQEYNLSFSMPQSGLGNMIAIQSSDSLGGGESVSDTFSNLMKLEELDRKEPYNDKFIKYVPSVGKEAGKRLLQTTSRESAGTFNFKEGDIARGGRSTQEPKTSNIQTDTAVGAPYDEHKNKLNENLTKALDENQNLEGEDTTPDPPEEKTIEDTKKSEEQIAKGKSQALVSSPYDYWIKDAVASHISTVVPILPIEVSLKIYGISGLMPGDLIRISYLPEKYYLHSYFQITKVAQSVDKSWSTSLTTQMRIAPFKREVPKKEIRVGKSYLRNVLKLTKIDAYIHAFGNLQPIDVSGTVSARLNYIDNIFRCEAVGAIEEGGRFDLPPVWSSINVKKLKKIFTKIKWGKWNEQIEASGKATHPKVKMVTNKEWTGPLQQLWKWDDDEIDYSGANLTVEGLNKGSIFYIITSGNNWVIWPGVWDKEKLLDLNKFFSITRGKEISKDLKDKSWKAVGQDIMGGVGETLAPVGEFFDDAGDAIQDAMDDPMGTLEDLGDGLKKIFGGWW